MLVISPVIQGILTTILTLIIAIVSILSGLKDNSESEFLNKFGKLNMLPVAILILGICLGSASGIYTRTHNLLGVKSELKSELRSEFEAGLYADNYSKCGDLKGLNGNDLKNGLKSLNDKNVNNLLQNCNNDSCLNAILTIYCKK